MKKLFSLAICVMPLLFTGCKPEGEFSVSDSTKVIFSPGNLQYTHSTDTWSFAANQLHVIGIDNAKDYPRRDGWTQIFLADKVDLFGWSTSETNFGVSMSRKEEYYYGSFVDWGTNKIGNDAPNTWRTLTADEWAYLLYGRTDASDLCGVAQINGVNGMFVLPDNWKCPANITLKLGFRGWRFAEYQMLTIKQWSKLEAAGAVFLPAAGYREGISVDYVQAQGFYWSATESNCWAVPANECCDEVCCLNFGADAAGIDENERFFGYSVRLVKDLQ